MAQVGMQCRHVQQGGWTQSVRTTLRTLGRSSSIQAAGWVDDYFVFMVVPHEDWVMKTVLPTPRLNRGIGLLLTVLPRAKGWCCGLLTQSLSM